MFNINFLLETEEELFMEEEDDDLFEEELNQLHLMSKDEYISFLEKRKKTAYGKLWNTYGTLLKEFAHENTRPDKSFLSTSLQCFRDNINKYCVIDYTKEQLMLVRTPDDSFILLQSLILISACGVIFQSLEKLTLMSYFSEAIKNARITDYDLIDQTPEHLKSEAKLFLAEVQSHSNP